MTTPRLRHLVAGLAVTVAALAGTGATAGASPAPDPAATDLSSTGSGSVALPPMTVPGLAAALRAGVPVYEAAQTETYWYPKGTYQMVEYRRVRDHAALGSPTPKFVMLGAAAPDTFFVRPGAVGQTISVNRHEIHQENVASPMTVFDPSPQRFTGGPLVRLPDGGPSVGLALIS